MSIKVPIKKKWNGMMPVNERFALKAHQSKQDLVIMDTDTGDKMSVSGDDILAPKMKSKPFQDKYGREPYVLYYYAFKKAEKDDNPKLL